MAVLIAAAAVALLTFPRPPEQTELMDAYRRARDQTSGLTVPIVSYNIRLDAQESDPNNHFTRRVHRLGAFVREVEPWIVGLQEPFSGQLLHLESLLPDQFAVVGDIANDHGNLDRADPRRHADFQTAILYDSSRLQLIEQDHVWLSRSPRTPGSKDWDSMGARTVTVAGFHVLGHGAPLAHPEQGLPVHFVVLNTHLDVRSARARQEQARLVRSHVLAWQRKHPRATIFVTGDMNSANGQYSHQILTQPPVSDHDTVVVEASEIVQGSNVRVSSTAASLQDAWDYCATMSDSCEIQPFAASFHGWLGPAANNYGVRLLTYMLLAIHESGVVLPHALPTSVGAALRAVADTWSRSRFNADKLHEALPSSLSRMHVDWILFRGSSLPPSAMHFANGRVLANPVFVAVMETRAGNFSSDHFPVVAVFDVAIEGAPAELREQ